MTENEFLLADRIHKIKSVDEPLGLRNNAYVSFSGGKDSVVLHHLVDMALPGNNIPRVFANTGLEFRDIVQHVKDFARNDKRFFIINQTANIKETLEKYGYPFKSKEHAHYLDMFNHGSDASWIKRYTYKIPAGRSEGIKKFLCPTKLLYQFAERGKYNFSDQCCYKLKKSLLHKWQKENKRKVTITGMRSEEGGQRRKLERIGCLSRNGTMFSPLAVCSSEWEDWFVKEYKIELCKLYYPPFNFKRTGCVGCPFNKDLQKELDVLAVLLPDERKKAELVFAPVYAEYRRIGYRLKDDGESLFFKRGE